MGIVYGIGLQKSTYEKAAIWTTQTHDSKVASLDAKDPMFYPAERKRDMDNPWWMMKRTQLKWSARDRKEKTQGTTTTTSLTVK